MTTLEPTTTTVGPSTMNPNEFSLNTSLADQFAEFDSVEFLKTSIPVRPPTMALCRDWRDPRRAMLGVKKGEGGGGLLWSRRWCGVAGQGRAPRSVFTLRRVVSAIIIVVIVEQSL